MAQFAKSMTIASLIMAIFSSMGFAYVVITTGSDKNLVRFLAAPLKSLGILLVPATTIVTSFINVTIPSASGFTAAVGATFIPVMIRAGKRPASAGSAVLMELSDLIFFRVRVTKASSQRSQESIWG